MSAPNEQDHGRLSVAVTYYYSPPLFTPGRVVATRGALDLLDRLAIDANALLARHCHGDWGDIAPEDAIANADALKYGARLLSAYRLGDQDERIWVITERDRSLTTLLLPQEY